MRAVLTAVAKKASLIACFAAASLAASGCTSTLSTNVTVTKSAAAITVTLNLGDDAAAVISRTPSLQAELNHVLTRRMGTPQHVTVTPSLVSWTGSLTYTQLIANSDVLGVGALSTSPTSAGVRVNVGIVDPTGLDAALAAGVRGEKDAAALLVTMEHYTNLSVIISFPGPASLVSSSGVTPVVSGNSATLTQSLYHYTPGAFVVDGYLSSGSTWYYWVGAVVVLAGIVLLLGRRRR